MYSSQNPMDKQMNDQEKAQQPYKKALKVAIQQQFPIDLFEGMVTLLGDVHIQLDPNEFFFYSIENGSFEYVQFFLEQGISIEATDPEGNTPLMHAIKKNRQDIVEYFLVHKANIYATNSQGRSVKDLAERCYDRTLKETVLHAITQAETKKSEQLGVENEELKQKLQEMEMMLQGGGSMAPSVDMRRKRTKTNPFEDQPDFEPNVFQTAQQFGNSGNQFISFEEAERQAQQDQEMARQVMMQAQQDIAMQRQEYEQRMMQQQGMGPDQQMEQQGYQYQVPPQGASGGYPF